MFKRIDCVMVSVLVSSVVDPVFEPRSGQTKDYKMSFFSTKNASLRRNAGWLGIRIMCPIAVTCLSVDCCVSQLAL